MLAEPIRIISDIHLGHPACILEKEESLAGLFAGAGTVVFNGDSVELRFLRGRSDGKRHAEALRRVCAQQGAHPVFINGNHDPILSRESHLDLADGAVLITHGDMLFHDISPWASEAGMMGEAHTRALSELDEDTLRDFEKRLSASKRAALAVELHKPNMPRGPFAPLWTIARECWPPWRPLQILRCWIETPRRAETLARTFRPQARIIAIGHTHRAGIWQRGPRIIINTGSFLSAIGQRTLIEMRGRELIVRKIRRCGKNFEPGETIRSFQPTRLRPEEDCERR